MNKLKSVMVESREGQNEESIHTALQPKPKPATTPKASVAVGPAAACLLGNLRGTGSI